MTKTGIVQILTLLITFLLFNPIYGQNNTGILEGVVTEPDIKYTLPGADIWVEGTSIGTISYIDGHYRLLNIPEGKQIVHFRYLGYEQKDVEVTIKAGETTTLDVILDPISFRGEEIIVTAQLRGQSRAINQQLNANSIVNIVSEDKIREVPDVNAAEAIGRLPGVAVQRNGGEGQKLMIRGLEPKFSAITVNGVKIPATDDTDRSSDLSMISSDMISGIELYKSPTPDMDGDAIAGTVNLIVKKAPEEMQARLNLAGAYNILNEDIGNYENYLQVSRRFLNNKLGLILQANMERNNRGSEEMTAGYNLITEAGQENLGGRIATLRDNEVVRKRKGASLHMDYDLKKHTNFSVYSLYSVTNSNSCSRSKEVDPFFDNLIKYSLQDSEKELELWSTSFLATHKLSFANIEWSLSHSRSTSETPYSFQINFREQASFANGEFDKYDHPSVFLTQAELKDSYTGAYLYDHYFRPVNNNEIQNTAFMNVSLPFKLGNKIGGFVKFGGKYNMIDRSNEITRFGQARLYLGGEEMNKAIGSFPGELSMSTNNKISMLNFVTGEEKLENFLGEGYTFYPVLDRQYIRDWYDFQKSNLEYDRGATEGDYTAIEEVSAAYLMSKITIGEMFTFIPGIRYEYSNNRYTGRYSSLDGDYGVNGYIRDTAENKSYGVLLPHFHMKFKPVKWFDIRFSAAKTLARPDYNFLLPSTQIDILNSRLSAGNPNLKHMEAWNYDLFLSIYNGKYGLLTIGGFYKDLKDIFYRISGYVIPNAEVADSLGYPGYSGYSLSSYGNLASGNVKGLEIELQTNLKFLPRPFDGIILSANYTRLYAQSTKYHYTSKPIYQFDPIWGQKIVGYEVNTIERKITIPGLVPHIFNLSFGYDYGNFSGRISANHQADYLQSVAQSIYLDQYGKSFWKFDAVLSQRINDHLIFILNLINISSQKEERYVGFNGFPTRESHYGPIVMLGVTLEL